MEMSVSIKDEVTSYMAGGREKKKQTKQKEQEFS